MEAQGLLTRVRQPSDERVVIIKLTRKGMGLQQSAEHIPGKMFAVTGLTPDKLLSLNQELDQLIANISD